MPEYLRSTSFNNVSGALGPFQHCKNTQLGMYPWLSQDPILLAHFQQFMRGQQSARGNWFDRLDPNRLFLDSANHETPLLVDVTGGIGHDIEAFHKKYPQSKGRLVLQDLPSVIANIKQLDDAISRVPHDFFQAQPITGARVYYFRAIMRNWGDEKVLEILSRTREACKKGYSKVLINEFILPATKVPLYPALLDINMMALLNGMERTRNQWITLIDQAGFKVIEFHDDSYCEKEGIIEIELK
ncbi:hypothetical protein ACMFMG_006185 [Clarireedia jacksonii]